MGIDLERSLDRLRQHAKPRQAGQRDVQSAGRTGGIPAALAQLEALPSLRTIRPRCSTTWKRGELLRMDRRYEDSTNAFMVADIKVKEWEETIRPILQAHGARWAAPSSANA